ncbi:hypothetical protein P4O66_001387 [Electrophorus voltai]|uniref:Transmembrane protein 196 n=1 Tax=Electrophorus voltai TaxID=2609070 RepID=A0AAD9DVH0_9TELE|nr:hypothetical protein P4O66_001387 [Electrophorus voltai]
MDVTLPLQLASLSVACVSIIDCTLTTWLSCRTPNELRRTLTNSEQQRMFLEHELSLHHSVEMAEKILGIQYSKVGL